MTGAGAFEWSRIMNATGDEGEGVPVRESALGRYRGYSEERFGDGVRSSCYVRMRDGVRLAVDILRPTSGEAPAAEPLPALWTHARYHRAFLTEQGEVATCVEVEHDWMLPVIRHGYVALTVDARGCGASFGVSAGQFSAAETRDAHDVTEWIASQPWCNGRVGMFGRSYLGITQYFAATQSPPHLGTLFPEMASFDLYAYAWCGGVFRATSRFDWQQLVGNLDQSVPMIWRGDYLGPVVPVDGDEGDELARAARREHRENPNWYRMLAGSPYRDSVDAVTGECLYRTRSAHSYRALIEKTGIPIYHLAGWYDMFPRDTLLWWRNLDNPQKIVIGPWFHVDRQGLDDAAEHLRWYDHWLKGVDNGVMDEDPIHYWTLDAREGEEWRSTPTWPLANEERVDFYLRSGPSGTSMSVNDGTLALELPYGAGHDDYVADYSATTGLVNRWANASGGPTGYPDMSGNDAKGLTYTTEPLSEDVEVTGHPIVRLWVSTDRDDCAFYAYLEDVHPDGYSQYVSEGVLLGSHRKLCEAPWDNLGLPYHSGLEADIEPLPEEPVELVFDLHPTSKRFPRDHRVRVTITCADRDNDRVPEYDPPAAVRVYTGGDRCSRIELPLVAEPHRGGSSAVTKSRR